jgi:hypothetical protein
LSHTLNPFLLYFSDRVWHFCLGLASTNTSHVAGIIGTYHHAQFKIGIFKRGFTIQI